MKPVTNYLRNLSKSMSYAAVDVSKEIMPNVGDFLSSNSSFIKATYASLKNPKLALRKSITAIQDSKVYQAAEYGAKNLFEDLRTGNFYNREREDKDSMRLAGMNADFNDLSEYGIDDDWESKLDEKPSKKNEITSGDLQISDTIEKTSSASTNATVNAVITSAEYNAKITKATAGNLYLQNERLFGGLHQDLTIVGKTMDSIQNITSTALQNIDKNQSDFFTAELKLSQERNAMLKEILEMQRNVYKTALQKEKEERDKDKKKNNNWENVQSGGIVDFEAYKEVVMKNISNQIAGLGIPTLGNENENMLAAFMTSPLKSITTGLMKALIPATTVVAAKHLDETIGGIFANLMADFSKMKNSDNKIAQIIGNIFGINTAVNKSISTNRFEKGAIPFDGITRKSIIEVIPGYLRRIEAFLSSSHERVYNYETGSWTTINDLKSSLEAKDKSYVETASRNFMKLMDPYFKQIVSEDSTTRRELEDAKKELKQFIYNTGKTLNLNLGYNQQEAEGITMSNYPNLYKHYNLFKELMNNARNGVVTINRNGNRDIKTVDQATHVLVNVAKDVMDAKSSQNRFYKSIEDDITNPFRTIYEDAYTGSHLKYSTPYSKIGDDRKIYGVKQDKDKTNQENFNFGHILFVKDNLGNTIFDYLQNINTEAIWWRETAFMPIVTRLNTIALNAGSTMTNIQSNQNIEQVQTNNTETNQTENVVANATTPPKNRSERNAALEYAIRTGSREDIDKIISNNNSDFYKSRNERLAQNTIGEFKKRLAEIEEVKNERDREKAAKLILESKAIDVQYLNDDEIGKLNTFIEHFSKGQAEIGAKEYINEIEAETEQNAATRLVAKYFLQYDIRSLADFRKKVEEEEKKEEKESEKEDDEKEEKEKTFTEKVGERIKKGASVVGSVVGVVGEILENGMNRATKGIYDLLYRRPIKLKKDEEDDDEDEIDEDDGKYHEDSSDTETDENNKKRTEFDGIMDLLQYKIKRTFKSVKTYIKADVVNPIKKWLGKELDDDEDGESIKEKFIDTIKEYGKFAFESFMDANEDIFRKAKNAAKDLTGVSDNGAKSFTNRIENRKKILEDIKSIDDIDNNDMLTIYSKAKGKYGIEALNYGSNMEALKRAMKYEAIMKYLSNTNKYKEFENDKEIEETFLPMLNELSIDDLKNIAKEYKIENYDKLSRNELIEKITEYSQYDKNFKFGKIYNNRYLTSRIRFSRHMFRQNDQEIKDYAKSLGITFTDQDTREKIEEKILNDYYDKITRSDLDIKNIIGTNRLNDIISNNYEILQMLNYDDPNVYSYAKEEGFVGTIDEKINRLIRAGIIESRSDAKIKDIFNTNISDNKKHEILDKVYLSGISNHAFGTDAFKFGPAYVTAGEKLITPKGEGTYDVSTIPKTGKIFLRNQAVIPKPTSTDEDDILNAAHEAGVAAIRGDRVSHNPYIPNFAKGSRRQRKKNRKRQEALAAARRQELEAQIDNNEDTITTDEAAEIVEDATQVVSEAAATNTIQSISSSTEGSESVTISGKMITAKDLVSQAKKHIGEMGAGGVVGGIASMLLGLVGGPLAGAAIGAGAALIHKSEFMQEKLFGEKGRDGKRQGGIVNKDIVDAAQRYAPDMFKYSLAGIIPGLITGFGPLPGMLIGGTIGYLKNNEKFTNKYFGEHGKLTLGTKEKRIIQNILPGAGKGALGGLIGGLVLGAGAHPFGLLGSMLIGSGLGMMASTEDFKNLLLGVGVDGKEREGGILGIIKDSFSPILKGAIEFKDKLLDTLENNIVKPISDLIQPLIHELPRIFGAIPNKISEILDTRFGKSITSFLKNITSPVSTIITKMAMPLANGAINLITSPMKLLGVAGRGIRKSQIRQHRADYMTAKDRIEFALDNDMGMSSYDRAMAAIGAEGGLTVGQATQLRDAFETIDLTKAELLSRKRKSQRNINNILDSFSTKDGKTLSKSTRDDIRKALENNNSSEVIRILSSRSYKGQNIGMTQSEIESLLNDRGLKSEMETYQRSKIGLKHFGDKKYKDKAYTDMENLLKQMGVDPNTISDPKERARFIKNLNTEIEDRKANGNENTMEPLNKISTTLEEFKDITSNFFSFMMNNALGNSEAAKKDIEKFNTNLNNQLAVTTSRAQKNMIDIGNAAVEAKIRQYERNNGKTLDKNNLEDQKIINNIKSEVFKPIVDENGNITGFTEDIADNFKEFADISTAPTNSTLDRIGRATINNISNNARNLGYLGADMLGGGAQLAGAIVNAGVSLGQLPVKLLSLTPGRFGTKMKKISGAMDNYKNLTSEATSNMHDKIRNGLYYGGNKVEDFFRNLDTKFADANRNARADNMRSELQTRAFTFDENYVGYYNIDHYIKSEGDEELLSVLNNNRYIDFTKESFEYYKNIKNEKQVQWQNINDFLSNRSLIKFIANSGGYYTITTKDLDVLLMLHKDEFKKLIHRIETYMNGIEVSIWDERKNKYKIKKYKYAFKDFGSFENLLAEKLKNGKRIGSVPNDGQTEQDQESEVQNSAFGTIPNYGLGTAVLSGLISAGKFAAKTAYNIGKGAVKLAWKGTKALAKGVGRFIPRGIKNIAGSISDKIADIKSNIKDSAQKLPGKFQELIHLGNGRMAVYEGKRDNDGNIIDIDAANDPDTKEALNKLEEDKKRQEEAETAQINTGNTLQEMINPSDAKSNVATNFIGTILKAIAIGGVVSLLWQPIIKPLFTKIWEGFIKPVGGWVLNTAFPWINDNIVGPFITKLPELIYNGINNINTGISKAKVNAIGTTDTSISNDPYEYFSEEEKNIVKNNGEYTNSMHIKQYLKNIEINAQSIANDDLTTNPNPARKEMLANQIISYIKNAKQLGASNEDIIKSLKRTKLDCSDSDYNKIIAGIVNNDEFTITEFKAALTNLSSLNDPSKGSYKSQVHSTAVNSAAITGGVIGTGAGMYAGAKIGATIGTALAPGVGTVIGGAVGLLAGLLTGKVAGEATTMLNGYGSLDNNNDKPLSKYGRYKEDISNLNILNNYNSLSASYANSMNSIIDTDFDENSVKNIINAAKEGKISVFSSEYWNGTDDTKLSNIYAKSMKVLAIPSIFISNMMRYFVDDIKQIQKLFTSSSLVKMDSTDVSKGVKFYTGTGKYGTGKYVKQNDPSVSAIEFNTGIDSEYQTIGDSGCGPAAAVNAIRSMYGKSKSLINAAKFALKGGYKEKNGGTKPNYFRDYFASQGLKSQTTANKRNLINNIRAGIPTVLMGQDSKGVSSSTPYGRNPHYVTATGVDSKGRVIIQDPESKYDNQLYSMKDLMNKTSFGVSAYGKGKDDEYFSIFDMLKNILNNSNAGRIFNSFIGIGSKFGKSKYGMGDYDKQIWNYLINELKLSEDGAAGIMGVLGAQSGLIPDYIEDSKDHQINKKYASDVDDGIISEEDFINDKRGYGILQWTNSNIKKALYKLAKENNKSIADPTIQLKLFKSQFESQEIYKPSSTSAIKTAGSFNNAAEYFLSAYNKAENKNLSNDILRQAQSNAQDYYSKYKGSDTTTTITTNETVSNNNNNNSNNNASEYSTIFDMLKNILNNSNAGRIFNSFIGISNNDNTTDNSGSTSSSSTVNNTTTSSSNNKKINVSSNKMINDVVNLALSQVGGGKTNGNSTKDNIYNDWWDNGFKDGAAPGSGNALDWCAAFVSWVMRHAGVPEDIVPNYRGCTSTGHDYIIKNYGAKAVSAKDSKAGDIMFFSNSNGNDFYHTGLIVDRENNNTVTTVEGNTGNGDTVSKYTYSLPDSRLWPIRPNYGEGSNEYKPLSKYGRYKDSLCVNCNTEDEYKELQLNRYRRDQLMQLEAIKQRSKYGKGTNEDKNYTHLINTIITILYTIADNTDKLNMIVSILNNKLGIDIKATDINKNTTKETLKQKILSALNTSNIISSTSKINNLADNVDNNDVVSVINMMNMIASE